VWFKFGINGSVFARSLLRLKERGIVALEDGLVWTLDRDVHHRAWLEQFGGGLVDERGGRVKVNDMELPESPLLFLRALLGGERVDELGGVTFELARDYPTVEEWVCLTEHLMLFACSSAWKEANRTRSVAA
jgi:hypothetical protein